ncbi:MAG TPA: hypothetical protein VFZ01_15435 [Geminicoccaceae bacterium]
MPFDEFVRRQPKTTMPILLRGPVLALLAHTPAAEPEARGAPRTCWSDFGRGAFK